jgi:alkylation response protein AidB-like acyl-CoA dehydrogenase
MRCGELGLLSVDVAEAYDGMQLDKVTSMLVSEKVSRSASFAATFGAQANLTIVPLSLFGTDAQKRQYLPRLLTGELVGAYCLSETGSGSTPGSEDTSGQTVRWPLRAQRREDVDH